MNSSSDTRSGVDGNPTLEKNGAPLRSLKLYNDEIHFRYFVYFSVISNFDTNFKSITAPVNSHPSVKYCQIFWLSCVILCLIIIDNRQTTAWNSMKLKKKRTFCAYQEVLFVEKPSPMRKITLINTMKTALSISKERGGLQNFAVVAHASVSPIFLDAQ